MTDTPTLKALEWGEYLAGLSPTERQLAIRASKQAYVANLPDDQVGRPPLRPLGEFVDEEIELPPMLVQPGLVARGGVTAMVSKGGKGKTAVSFNRLLYWAMGKPLFEELPEIMAPSQPLRSVIVENEGAGWHTQKILRRILGAEHLTDEEREAARTRVHVWGDGGWSGMKLDKPENLDLVKRAVESVEADILFLEPFRGLWRGEENSSTEMVAVMDAFHEIANEYGCAVLITHHERKAGAQDGDPMDAIRGSAVFADLGAVMERWAPVQAGRQREWSLTKARYAEAPAPVRMEWVHERWGYRYIPEDEKMLKAVAVIAGNGGMEMTVSDVAMELEENQPAARRGLDRGVEAGRLKVRPPAPGQAGGGKRYRLADDQAVDGALNI